ncbi:hypothetical protein FQN50_004204 [Emmonsiellopsis sp. PD_5]|nr:hypothetical protein FQN50_004204 [Emmonsiellopsis sp. PD_5]
MALPAVHTAADCTDFSLTALAFLPQLTSLPSRLIESGTDIEALKNVYVTTNPFVTAVAFALFLAPVFLIVSEIRLTYNYWRKGGYNIGSEDYRWVIVRNKVNNPFLFFLFNATFISLIQSILLVLITAPTYLFVLLSTIPNASQFQPIDFIFSPIIVFFIFIEALADQQQWKFQNAKKAYQQIARVPPEYKDTYTSDDLDRGFVVSGPWAWCRHPNFAAEQAIWLTLYQWSCIKSQQYYHWAGIGALCYVLLFQGSTKLTESITAGKYPDYKQYQLLVGKFIPRLGVEPRGGGSDIDASSSTDGAAKKQEQPSKSKAAEKKKK